MGTDGVLGEVYATLMARVETLADRLVAAIHQQDDGYRTLGRVPVGELRRSCRDNILAVLQQLAGAVPAGLDPLDVARTTGRRRAEQRLPLDTVLRSLRIGGRLIWDELADEARRAGPEATDAVLDRASSVWEVLDRASSELAIAYRATEQEMARADAASAGAVLESLLSGRGREPGMAAEAARTLGLPTGGGFAVVVAAEIDGGRALPPGIEAALLSLGLPSAWRRWPDQFVGVVALAGRGVTELRDALARCCHERIGVSAALGALADVQQGHLQAGTALATLPLEHTGVVLLDDALPAALVVATPDLGERLVRVLLGDVLALPVNERDLMLETIRAWLAADGSPSATAATLGCHRNTVLNRLRRIEALIGRTPEATTTRVELSLALTALDVLPGEHLGDPGDQVPRWRGQPAPPGPSRVRDRHAPSSATRSSAAL